MMALARRIVSGDEDEDEAETMEEVFAQAGNAEATAEELLVDEGWKIVEVEPETVAGHTGATGATPTVTTQSGLRSSWCWATATRPSTATGLFRSTGTATTTRPTEPQRTLFSWAEFMAEEPVKPKGRKSKPQPATLSMFEWALDLAREREEEPVGVGR